MHARSMSDTAFTAVRTLVLALAALAALALVVAQPSRAEEVIGTSKDLTIEANKGRLVRLAQPASTVYIADPEIADVQVRSPNLIYVFGRQAGETTLFAVNDTDQVLLSMNVIVNHNVSRLNRTLDALLPDQTIEVRSIDGAVILSGKVNSAAQAEDARQIAAQFVTNANQIINRLEVSGPTQVNLRVRVIEVSRQVIRNLGVNWDSVIRLGNSFAFGLFTGNPTALLLPSAVFPPTGGAAGNILARNNNVNSLGLFYQNGDKNLNALIDALETEGLIKTLAEPNLTAVSGETASFLAGGEFPIPVPQRDNVITIEFKKFGVSLAFTPTLLDPERMSLKVAPEVSQLSNTGAINLQGFVIPALTTRRAETTVELASGQSFAIAGLLQNNSNTDIRKVPGLGDVPVLGELFKSSQWQRDETELVIMVTPFVVKPFNAEQAVKTASAGPNAPAPAPPGDVNRIFLGKGREVETPRRLQGPAGFVLE